MVATCALGFSVRLEGLVRKDWMFARYEPEVFPGLVYRLIGRGVMLVFASGRVVVTGAKTREAMEAIFDDMYPVLTEFKKLEGRES